MAKNRRICSFCRKKIEQIDYKDSELVNFLTAWGKIKRTRETRACAKHQTLLTRAIKRARFLGLIPYVSR